MDTYPTVSAERVAARRRHAFWDQWDNDEEELNAIEKAALDLLDALDNHRESTYIAADVAKIDALAADISGTTYDWLRARIKQCKDAADEVGIPPEQVDIDTSLLAEEADKWIARSKARA
jgi:hypothetical protein